MPFEELEHTADVKMRITAPDFISLLAESGFALSQVMYGTSERENSDISTSIEAEGTSAEELCVNFLSELLFIMETEYLVPSAFSLTVSEKSVTGTVFGVSFERGKHSGGIEVKGISYSGLTLTKKNTEYELIIIFDI
ncbi:MAG TPA: archease [Methanocorpusculum sp.]|nr:archease [Methanocorpusculum sp.]